MEIKMVGDFISMDNGKDYLMVRKSNVLSVHIFPPDEDAVYPTEKWRVQVTGEGYIVFETDTRFDAVEIVNTVSKLLE
jgi:hypothetical protein